MRSILRQLAKYCTKSENPETGIAPPSSTIHIKEPVHPYQEMVEALCDITDPWQRKQAINDALAALNGFTPPSMTGQLYPMELAILYYLFYYYKIKICSEARTDSILGAFLQAIIRRDGLDAYMQTLKENLNKNSTSVFLYRVMLAALGDRGKWDNKRDHVDKEYGYKAARVMGVEASAKAAGRGLDSLAGAAIEELILGRIAYIAFWEWSHLRPISDCSDYLTLPAARRLSLPAPSPDTP